MRLVAVLTTGALALGGLTACSDSEPDNINGDAPPSIGPAVPPSVAPTSAPTKSPKPRKKPRPSVTPQPAPTPAPEPTLPPGEEFDPEHYEPEGDHDPAATPAPGFPAG